MAKTLKPLTKSISAPVTRIIPAPVPDPAAVKQKIPVVRERSAGIVVFRSPMAKTQDFARSVKREAIYAKKAAPLEREYLLLHYEEGHWDFPKGHLEEGEADEEAARRELQEETGLLGDAGKDRLFLVPGFTHEFSYWYTHAGTRFFKTVMFYLAEFNGSGQVRLSNEHIGFEWLPYAKARERLTFDNAKKLLDVCEGFLEKKKC